MQYAFATLLAASMTLIFDSAKAQTPSTFDDLTLPGIETDLAGSYLPGDSFSFRSGNVRFYGEHTFWGGYSRFNVSNITDTTDHTFLNDRSAITGGGENGSANYGIAFVPLDFTTYESQPLGVGLINEAAGGLVHGAYFTNTTYVYHYIADPAINFKAQGHHLTLTIRGYENGSMKPDSVNFPLADFRDSLNVLVDDWTWVDLTRLGTVDSLTFDLSSSDTGSYGMNVPAYFAIDRLVTLESAACTPVAGLRAGQIGAWDAVISWERDPVEDSLQGVRYFYAVDQSPTLAPEQAGSGVPTGNFTTADSVVLQGLTSNTTYYFHIQKACMVEGRPFALSWDTLSFTTGATSIGSLQEPLQVRLHPNPAQDRLSVGGDQPLNLRVIDLQGKVVLEKQHATQIDIRSLAPGLYFLEATRLQDKRIGVNRFTKL